MMITFLMWFSARLPMMLIQDEGRPYLERYYLCTLFNVRFYLHRFVDSDPDRGFHDHPWRWAKSIILSGWYWEHNRYGIKRVRLFNSLNGDSFHRVVLPSVHVENVPVIERQDNCKVVTGLQTIDQKQPCWTLFFHHAPRAKPWGFLRDKGQLGTIYVMHVPRGNPEWWHTAPRARDVRAEVRA